MNKIKQHKNSIMLFGVFVLYALSEFLVETLARALV